MTLAGLVKHLAYVEDDRFGRELHDEPHEEPDEEPDEEPRAWVDWAAEPHGEWESAQADTPEALRTLWEESAIRARTGAEKAFTVGGPGCKAPRSWPDGRSPSLRWVLTHMIEE